jgi:hypothetical protein
MNEHQPPAQPPAPVPPPFPSAPAGQQSHPEAGTANPVDVSRAFPVQAAKFSLYSALFAFVINCFAVQGGRAMPAIANLLIAVICGVLILGGFVLGIVALAKNRRTKLPGVTGYAVGGILINGLFLVLNVVLFTRLFLGWGV